MSSSQHYKIILVREEWVHIGKVLRRAEEEALCR